REARRRIARQAAREDPRERARPGDVVELAARALVLAQHGERGAGVRAFAAQRLVERRAERVLIAGGIGGTPVETPPGPVDPRAPAAPAGAPPRGRRAARSLAPPPPPPPPPRRP